MRSITAINEPRVAKALSHPLRAQILGILEERRASPRELSEELGAPLGNVSYHVRALLHLKLIKLVKKTPRRGAIEHHYRALTRPFLKPFQRAVPPIGGVDITPVLVLIALQLVLMLPVTWLESECARMLDRALL